MFSSPCRQWWPVPEGAVPAERLRRQHRVVGASGALARGPHSPAAVAPAGVTGSVSSGPDQSAEGRLAWAHVILGRARPGLAPQRPPQRVSALPAPGVRKRLRFLSGLFPSYSKFGDAAEPGVGSADLGEPLVGGSSGAPPAPVGELWGVDACTRVHTRTRAHTHACAHSVPVTRSLNSLQQRRPVTESPGPCDSWGCCPHRRHLGSPPGCDQGPGDSGPTHSRRLPGGTAAAFRGLRRRSGSPTNRSSPASPAV